MRALVQKSGVTMIVDWFKDYLVPSIVAGMVLWLPSYLLQRFGSVDHESERAPKWLWVICGAPIRSQHVVTHIAATQLLAIALCINLLVFRTVYGKVNGSFVAGVLTMILSLPIGILIKRILNK
jgi:hypothetical protein